MTNRFQVNTCEVCGWVGMNVHLYPYYSPELERDAEQYQCDNITACLNRKYTKMGMWWMVRELDDLQAMREASRIKG